LLLRRLPIFIAETDDDDVLASATIGQRRSNTPTSAIMTVDIDYTRRNKKPRMLTDNERAKLDEFVDAIHYSSRYVDQLPLQLDTQKADFQI
jgi:hypothetical protein